MSSVLMGGGMCGVGGWWAWLLALGGGSSSSLSDRLKAAADASSCTNGEGFFNGYVEMCRK